MTGGHVDASTSTGVKHRETGGGTGTSQKSLAEVSDGPCRTRRTRRDDRDDGGSVRARPEPRLT